MEFGIITGALLLAFIGLVIWAYSSKRKKSFDEAAQLALDEQDRSISVDQMEQRK